MEALGIDVKLIIAQVINFTILYFVLSKILYKPIISLLDKRKKAIEDAEKNSKAIEEKLLKIEEREKKTIQKALSDAKEEKQRIISEAQAERSKIIKEAKKSAERVAQKGIAEIDSYEEKLSKKIKDEVAEELVGKVIQRLQKETRSKRYPLLREIIENE